MADQGKWFKLWCTALYDEALQNLSLEDWARWAKLGTYIKVHGSKGKINFRTPFYALKELLRVQDETTLRRVLETLPHLVICNGSDTVTISIKFKNWHKYQGDFSGDRVKRYRDRVTANVTAMYTAQEEKRREEKRRDKKESIKRKKFLPPTPQEVEVYGKQIGFDVDVEKFLAYYAATDWTRAKTKINDWKACVRTWKLNSKDFENVKTLQPVKGNAYVI